MKKIWWKAKYIVVSRLLHDVARPLPRVLPRISGHFICWSDKRTQSPTARPLDNASKHNRNSKEKKN